MRYLDSNVFIYPILYRGKKSDKAKSILAEMVEGVSPCVTASLTLDEVIWVVMREVGRDEAIQIGRDILSLPNLRILDVTDEHIMRSIKLMEKYPRLKPRDAIHIAVSINAGVFTIISDDDDFDTVSEINRVSLE